MSNYNGYNNGYYYGNSNRFTTGSRIGMAIGIVVLALLVLCCLLVVRRRRMRRFGGVPPQGGMMATGPGVASSGGGFLSRFRGSGTGPGYGNNTYGNNYGGGNQMATTNGGGMFSKFRGGGGPTYPEPTYSAPAGPPPGQAYGQQAV